MIILDITRLTGRLIIKNGADEKVIFHQHHFLLRVRYAQLTEGKLKNSFGVFYFFVRTYMHLYGKITLDRVKDTLK